MGSWKPIGSWRQLELIGAEGMTQWGIRGEEWKEEHGSIGKTGVPVGDRVD